MISTAKQIDPKIIQELMHMEDDLSVLNIDLAESPYSSVLLIEPNNTDALFGLGDLLINIDDALDIYQNTLELDNQPKFKLEKKIILYNQIIKLRNLKISDLLEPFRDSK